MVNKILIVLLSLFAAVLTPPARAVLTSSSVPSHNHSSTAQGGSALSAASVAVTGAVSAGSISSSGTLSSTKGCGASFVRRGPNYCMAESMSASTPWVDATICTARAFSGVTLPAGARMALLSLRWQALSNGAVGGRINEVVFFSDSICSVSLVSTRSLYAVQEFVATTAGTVIGQSDLTVLVPVPTTNTIYTTQTNAGGNGNADIVAVYVQGYFD